MKKWFASEANRAYVYRILFAVGSVIAGWGFLTDDQLLLLLGLVTAVLNIMPTANTKTRN